MEKSESIKNLAMALVKFHSIVGKIKKDSTNPFFKSKYADLSDIQDEISAPLIDSGLAISQLPMGKNQLTTILIHSESGEYIMGSYEMTPVKNDPQSVGSCITYQKRYALGAILNLNIDKDDDGNAASKLTPVAPTAPPAVPTPPSDPVLYPITDKMFGQLLDKVKSGDKECIGKAKAAYTFTDLQKEDLNNAVKALKVVAKDPDPTQQATSSLPIIKEADFRALMKQFKTGDLNILKEARKVNSFSKANEDYINKIIVSQNKKAA